jgi:hypothetical protein
MEPADGTRIKIKLSAMTDDILNLDLTGKDRGVTLGASTLRWIEVEGSLEAWKSILDELEAVAAGLLCDASDDPSATRRCAAGAAVRVRKAILKATEGNENG